MLIMKNIIYSMSFYCYFCKKVKNNLHPQINEKIITLNRSAYFDEKRSTK